MYIYEVLLNGVARLRAITDVYKDNCVTTKRQLGQVGKKFKLFKNLIKLTSFNGTKDTYIRSVFMKRAIVIFFDF